MSCGGEEVADDLEERRRINKNTMIKTSDTGKQHILLALLQYLY